MMVLRFLLLLTFFWSSSLWSQTRVTQQQKEKFRALDAFQKQLIQEKMSLTEVEYNRFAPLYKDYQLKLSRSKKAFRKKWYPITPQKYSDAQAASYLKDVIKLQRMETDLFELYSGKISNVIGSAKTLRLMEFRSTLEKRLVEKSLELGIQEN